MAFQFHQPQYIDSSAEFEFGPAALPASHQACSSDRTIEDSPAGALFFQGKLVPHSYPQVPPPFQSPKSILSGVHSTDNGSTARPPRTSRSTSTSSNLSKSGLSRSSRSNSYTSRSNSLTSSTTRTNSSGKDIEIILESSPKTLGPKTRKPNKSKPQPMTYLPHTTNQGWQFISSPPTGLGSPTEISRQRKSNIHHTTTLQEELKWKMQNTPEKKTSSGRSSSWFGGKVFKSFVSSCRECHALEPSSIAQPGLGRK